ncbi:MAG: elongation factor Ts [Parcubacteria group bacterium]|nr:elongation factor Ts [Parcubacteria group bacterium]
MKDLILKIRNQTGAGIMDIKEALEASGGDEAAALAELAKKGKAIAAKRAERTAGEGWIGSYVHQNGKIAGMVKLACETDFVARNAEFQALAHDIAMHIAATNPACVSEADALLGTAEADMLLNQAFIKDSSKTIRGLVEAASAKIGEKIEIAGFSRMEM